MFKQQMCQNKQVEVTLRFGRSQLFSQQYMIKQTFMKDVHSNKLMAVVINVSSVPYTSMFFIHSYSAYLTFYYTTLITVLHYGNDTMRSKRQ